MKKGICAILVMGLVTMSIFAGGAKDAPAPAAAGSNANKTLVFIPKATNSQFWVAIYDGTKKAAQELGYKEVKFLGTTNTSDIAGQINVFNDAKTSRPTGILIAVNDANALKNPIEESINDGVPVVTVNAGVNSDKVLAHAATDNYNAAAMGAAAFAKLIGEKGTVLFIGIDMSSENGRMRENGFRDEIKKYPNIRVLQSQYSEGNISKAMNVTNDVLTGNPDIVGIFCAQDNGGTGAAQTVKQRGLKDKIKIVAFDSTPDEFQLFLDDFLDALVVQDPFMQGYLGVIAIDKVINNKPIESKFIETPVKIVTKANMTEPDVYEINARNSAIKDIMTSRGINPKQ
jgi:ribose transport system substrate-binding protein